MKPRYELQPGNELRGLKIRLYPNKETEELLAILAKDSRTAWNWLVNTTGFDPKNDVIRARNAFAIRKGLVGPRPTTPNYDGLTPETSKATKETYIEACRAWNQAVLDATKKLPECQPRKLKDLITHFRVDHDYQLLQKVIGWKYDDTEEPRKIVADSHFLQALAKNYRTKAAGMKCKKFRRGIDPMPIQVRSGDCFKVGAFGDRRGKPFYDCQIMINGLKIPGRLPGKWPEGRILEGVSLTKEADGWWASVKQEVPIRIPPPAVPGTVIGIDTGLDNLVAMSEVRIVSNKEATIFSDMGDTLEGYSDPIRVANTRNKIFSERIAGRQAEKKPVGRLQLQASRHIRHLIFNKIVKPLATVETIKVEKLNARIGQMGSSMTSAMRTAVRLLQERYGTRVREVEPHYTSQDCSQCGKRSKESWSYEHGRYGECPFCEYRADRDVNAARNVAARPPISLEI